MVSISLIAVLSMVVAILICFLIEAQHVNNISDEKTEDLYKRIVELETECNCLFRKIYKKKEEELIEPSIIYNPFER